MLHGAEIALALERRGAAVYEELAQKAKQPLVKELFQMLAESSFALASEDEVHRSFSEGGRQKALIAYGFGRECTKAVTMSTVFCK